jgi:AraC-like DNA-binding protein
MLESVSHISCGKFISREEWIHPSRKEKTYEILFVTKGKVLIAEEEAEYSLGENEVLILEPKKKHFGTEKSRDTQFFWLHFSGLDAIPEGKKHLKIENSYNLLLLFKQILSYTIDHKPAEALDYLTRLILLELFCENLSFDSDYMVEKASAWIRANRDRAITVKDLARHFGYNEDYLNRSFKAHYGKPIKSYIDRERIGFIKQLLLEDALTLAEVAQKTGFQDYKYFLKYFKYHEGITPTEFKLTYSKTMINTF